MAVTNGMIQAAASLVVTYAAIGALWILVGSLVLGLAQNQTEERIGARIFLAGFVWPFVLLWWVFRGIRWLFRTAFGKD